MVLLVDYSKRRSIDTRGSITILGQTYNEEDDYSLSKERLRTMTVMRSNSMDSRRIRLGNDDEEDDDDHHRPGSHYFNRRRNDEDDHGMQKKPRRKVAPRRISSFDYRVVGRRQSLTGMRRQSDAALAVAALEAAVAAAEEEEKKLQQQQQQQGQEDESQEEVDVVPRRPSLKISLSTTNMRLSAADRKALAEEVEAALEDEEGDSQQDHHEPNEIPSLRNSLSSSEGLTEAVPAPPKQEQEGQPQQEVPAPRSLSPSAGATNTRSERRRLMQEAAAGAAHEKEEEQEMPSLLDSMSNLGGSPAIIRTTRGSRSPKRNRKSMQDERMPATTTTGRTMRAPHAAAPTTPLKGFQDCGTNVLIQEHRNRRPTVLVEADVDDSEFGDMSESHTNHFGNDSDSSIDFSDLLRGEDDEELKQEETKEKATTKKDWSKPSRVTVDKNAPSVSKALTGKPRRNLYRSASASQMGVSLSCITEGANNEEEAEEEQVKEVSSAQKKPDRASLMKQARGHQSLTTLNLSSRNIFANNDNKRPGLQQRTMSFTRGRGLSPKKQEEGGTPKRGLGQKVLSFTLRRRATPSRSKSLDESISSIARFEQSMNAGLALSSHHQRDLEGGKIPSLAEMEKDGSDSSSSNNKNEEDNGWKSISKPTRQMYRRSRSMDNSMSCSNLDASTRIPAGYGKPDSRFGFFEGGLPKPPTHRISDPTSCCHPVQQQQQQCPLAPHVHKHGIGGCAHCDRRMKLCKSTSISKLIMESRMEHTDVVGRVRTRPTLGRKSMSMSLVTASRRKEQEEEKEKANKASDIPTDITCDLVTMQRDLVSFQRRSARNLKKALAAEKAELAEEMPDLEMMEDQSSDQQHVTTKGIPTAEDLGYGDDTPESHQPVSMAGPLYRRKNKMMIGSLSDGDYTTDEESDYDDDDDDEDYCKGGLDRTRHVSRGIVCHPPKRRAASMGHISKRMDSSNNNLEESFLRPSLVGNAGRSRNQMLLRTSTGQASRRNLMGDKNKQMDTSGFVTGSRIRRIDDASQLMNGDASQLWGSKRW